MYRRIPLMLWLFALVSVCSALPNIERVRIISPHFEFSAASSDAERVRTELAPLAETIWDSLSKVTGFTPPVPVTVVVRDEDDYSNGYAIPFADWVSVWSAPLDFDFRGGIYWRGNVLSHELSHVFTMRALGYTSKWLGHSAGVDVSTAKANEVSVGTEYSTEDLESWLAEGLAQYGAERCGFDGWDSHRDMLERVAWLSGAIQPDPMLVTFTGDSRESEVVYNQGYSFIRFVMNHGRSSLAEFLRYGGQANIRQAVQVSFGKPFEQVFAMWRQDLHARHGNPTPEQFKENASWLKVPFRLDYLRTQSPIRVGQDRYFLSSHRNDNGETELFHVDAENSVSLISSNVDGRMTYDPQGKILAYIHMDFGMDHRQIREIYSLDLRSGTTTPLTKEARAVDASFGPDGLYYIGRRNGSNHLYRYLGLENSQEILTSPAGYDLTSLAASSHKGVFFLGVMGIGGYRLVQYNEVDGSQKMLLGGHNVRDPYVAEGYLYVSLELHGVWQIGKIPEDHLDAPVEVLTHEQGGAFQPSVNNGVLSFESYGPHGFLPQELVLAQIAPSPLPGQALTSLTQPPNLAHADINAVIGSGSGNSISILGMQTFTNFVSQRPATGDSESMGNKFMYGATLELADPSQENFLYATYQGMRGAGGTYGKQGLDNTFALAWQSESFYPYVSAQASLSQQTPEWGNHPHVDTATFLDGRDTTTNAYPQFTDILLQLMLSQPLNSVWSLDAMGAYESESEYVPIFGGASWTADKKWDLMAGITGSKIQYGRYGALSGITFSTQVGILQDTDATQANPMTKRCAVSATSLTLYSNLYRSILLSAGVDGNVFAYNDSTITSYGVNGSITIPLPRMNASIHLGDRSLSFFDPRLVFTYSGINLNADTARITLPTDNMLASIQRTGAWHPQGEVSQTMPWSSTRVTAAQASVQLDWQVITIGHMASSWYVAETFPVLHSKLQSPTLAVGLSF